MAMTSATSGCAEAAAPRANLLAERQAQLKARRSALRHALARFVAVLALGAVLVAGMLLVRDRLTDMASLTRARLVSVGAENARLAATERAANARNASAEFLRATGEWRRRWSDVIAAVGEVMPREIWMGRIVVKKSEGRELLLVYGYSPGLDILPSFMRTLSGAVGVEEAYIEEVNDAQIDGRHVVRFACKVVLRSNAQRASKPETEDERSARQTR